jgi:methylphosphotriester-DNA--protein-cysteine methyltransferase
MPLWQWNAPRALSPWLAGLAASTDEAAPERVRVMPDGGGDLLFSAPASGGAWTAEVFGAKTRALVVEDAERMEKIAVRLRPGAAARWLGVPAHTLTGRAVPLDALWGRAARELTARLEEARGRSAQRALVEAALLARAPCGAEPVAAVDAAVAAIVASGGRAPVHALTRALGTSGRCLERAFREHVGLAPKRFARIVRLARARSALARGASQLEAALAGCYFDQAHFHRDCRALAGVGPAELAAPSLSYKRPCAAQD